MYFAYTHHFASDPKLVAVQKSENTSHALVSIGDTYYDPTIGTWSPASANTHPVLFTLNYGQTMYIATHDHDKMRLLTPTIPLDSP